MASDPSKLSRFWKELKRRKVVRVITIYAAAAFVILEVVSIIVDPLKLPEWTLPLIIVLLCVGFIIAVILSWIYDIHPDRGMVKTEPAHSVEEEGKPVSSNSWKIASYISFVVIAVLIVLNIIPRSKENEILDKSIAVLPFRNDSPDEGKMYFINGTMEAILDNLCKIEDLRVPGRTSVEQYRENPKPIPTVAEEMNVSYILEGSGHRDGNNVRLYVQLLDGRKDKHIWSKSYDADIEDIFAVQSKIAQLVAAKIEAIITPEEKELIEKIPTTNLTAWDFYQRGREEYLKSSWFSYDSVALERAGNYFHKALEYDSTFARAYTGLAWVYGSVYRKGEFFSETYMDSLLTLAEIALWYDSQLAEAYTIKGEYFTAKNQLEKALIAYNSALELNPNDWMAYLERGWYYYWHYDLVQALNDFHKAAFLNRGAGLSDILFAIATAYSSDLGFKQEGLAYNRQALELSGDSIHYYDILGSSEQAIGNFKNSIEIYKKGFKIDSNHLGILGALGHAYLSLGELEESFKYFKKHVETLEYTERDYYVLNNWHRIGYVYLKNGYNKEAEYFFDRQLEFCNKSIDLGRPYGLYYVYYDLAALYAFQGEKEKALDNLNVYIQNRVIPLWMVTLIKGDPLFDNIRDEPEFQKIVGDMEAKYQAEHERVRQWLEENDML
jgi:TolB-like protein/Tfp pilus assembly protein PilF